MKSQLAINGSRSCSTRTVPVLSGLKLALAAFGASLLGVPAASANPISFYFSVDGGANYLQFGTTTTSGTNSAVFSAPTPTGSFSISATATGSPTLAAPNFNSTTLEVVSTTAGTLIVVAVESGLNTPSVSGFNIGLTSGADTTQPIIAGVGIVDSAGTYMQLASSLLSIGAATPVTVNYQPAGDYSLVEQYSATFGSNGGTVRAAISESSIAEPMSLSLLGAALAGVCFVRGRRMDVS